jgi:hypothetical protein
MTAGVPGTGIGGLFYVLLVAVMPLRELVVFLRGRSSAARLRAMLGQIALTAGILAALSFEAWLLVPLFLPRAGETASSSRSAAVAQAARASSVAAFATLAFVLFSLTLLRLFVRRTPREARTCRHHAPPPPES